MLEAGERPKIRFNELEIEYRSSRPVDVKHAASVNDLLQDRITDIWNGERGRLKRCFASKKKYTFYDFWSINPNKGQSDARNEDRKGRQNFKKEQASFCQAFIVGTTLFKSFT